MELLWSLDDITMEVMVKYDKDPYDFPGCSICLAAKTAEANGRSFSETELKRAFASEQQKQRTRLANQANHRLEPEGNKRNRGQAEA